MKGLVLSLFPDTIWHRTNKFSPTGAALADRHYSRRTVGARQFMPPGQTLVLETGDGLALFGWHRPDPTSGIRLLSGLDGWTCTIFRNEGPRRSSDLIIEAEQYLVELGKGCGPDGLITYVWIDRIVSPNPGYCFQCAGWRKTGWSADRKKRLLQKPYELAGILP